MKPSAGVLRLVCLWTAALGLAAAAPVAFPAGLWQGVAIDYGSIQKKIAGDKTVADTSGYYTFVLTVSQGGTVTGSMAIQSLGDVENKHVKGYLNLTAPKLSLTGDASLIQANGNAKVSGQMTVADGAGGMTLPINLDVPSSFHFSPALVTCNVVRGNLANEANAAQLKAGFATSVSAPFIAFRVGPKGKTDTNTVEGWVSVMENLDRHADKDFKDLTHSELGQLIQQVHSVRSAISGSSSCGEQLFPKSETGVLSLFDVEIAYAQQVYAAQGK